MKVCPKCGLDHSNPGYFCSRVCANSRTWNFVNKSEVSNSLTKYYKGLTEEQKQVRKDRMAKVIEANKAAALARLMDADISTLGHDARRKRVLIEQNFCCGRCGISDWLGSVIVLELDHIDGNKKNNVRDNLIALCPNCHSQTPTWRGRKRVMPT